MSDVRVDGDWQFDIDDILRVAEQRSVEELKNSATDQLLSQFKVSLFSTFLCHLFCIVYQYPTSSYVIYLILFIIFFYILVLSEHLYGSVWLV